jgi:tripartite-type tricarboxylate transporter receptor subunit TctC
MKSLMRLVAMLAIAGASAAFAQGYPNKPIKVVVPWPGQATDLVARVVAQKLTESLGQPRVVDNRPGAGGVIGSDVAAGSPADG